MQYKRMPIEVESPEELGYGNIRYNLSESSVADQSLGGLGLVVPDLTLLYGEHRGSLALRSLIVAGESGLAADEVLITGGAAGIGAACAARCEADGYDVVVIDQIGNGLRADLSDIEATAAALNRAIKIHRYQAGL